jgi:hypothetical protein
MEIMAYTHYIYIPAICNLQVINNEKTYTHTPVTPGIEPRTFCGHFSEYVRGKLHH